MTFVHVPDRGTMDCISGSSRSLLDPEALQDFPPLH